MLGSSSLAPFQKYAHNISPVLIPYLYQLKTLMRQNFHFLHIALVQCSVSFFLFFRSRSKVESISSRTSCYLTGKPLHQKKLFNVLSRNILALSQDVDHHPYLMNCLQSIFLLMLLGLAFEPLYREVCYNILFLTRRTFCKINCIAI